MAFYLKALEEMSQKNFIELVRDNFVSALEWLIENGDNMFDLLRKMDFKEVRANQF